MYSKVKLLSRVRLFATPWTVAYQPPPSMEFSRQGYCRGLPFPSPGDLPNTGMEPVSLASQAESLPSEPLTHENRQEHNGERIVFSINAIGKSVQIHAKRETGPLLDHIQKKSK